MWAAIYTLVPIWVFVPKILENPVPQHQNPCGGTPVGGAARGSVVRGKTRDRGVSRGRAEALAEVRKNFQ